MHETTGPPEGVSRFTFEYLGALSEGAHDRIVVPQRPNIIRLYRQLSPQDSDIWFIMAGFPKPKEPFPSMRHCADFMNIVQIIEESDAAERRQIQQIKPGDDSLLFSRMLREASEQPAEICDMDRELSERPWGFDGAGVSIGSLTPIPQYDCRGCGESSYAGNFGRMTGSTISYVCSTASRYGDENEPAFRWGNNHWSAEQLDTMFR